jgi:acetyltransferase-like isoleucine patch superfamily enzyme
LLTHQDFGHFNGNELRHLYPLLHAPITICENVVIGCDSTVLAGTRIESQSVVGAKSLVIGHIPSGCLVAGSPARFIKKLKA